MRLCFIHLPRFPVQRKVAACAELRKKPLCLLESARGHPRVAFASSAALELGIRPGQTQTAAQALCPELRTYALEPEAERQALGSLGEALLSLGPAFQLCPAEGLWLDGSAAHLCGGEEGWAHQVVRTCEAHGYLARVAVASEPFTARALAEHGRAALTVVQNGASAEALAALPLRALGVVGEGVIEPLGSLGLQTLGEVAALPQGAVVARLGQDGMWAQRLCRGEDDTQLVAEPCAEVLEEQVILEWPAESLEPLAFALKIVLDRISGRLRGRALAAVRLDLSLKLDPAGEATLPLRLARPSSDPKLLLELCRHRVMELSLPNPVGGVTVRLSEASEDRAQQLLLGDRPSGDAALEVVLARLSTTLGDDALFCAESSASHRPESGYAHRPFSPPQKVAGLWAEARREPPPSPPEAPAGTEDLGTHRPVRFFGRPATLEAEVGAQGEIVSARLLGRRRKAEGVMGPERLCGEWWDHAYARDYYRVHFEGLGPVWIFRDDRDGRFYLHGMFD